MNIKLHRYWEQLSGSFWFVPGLMVLLAIVLALGMTALDEANPREEVPALSGVYTGSSDGARSLLSAIAGSMISVAGITFSITMATLSLASSQLGPRLLQNFMRDRGNQVVLGTFVAIFTYCLLVLRTIRSGEEDVFVPHLSVTLAFLMALAGVGVLIYFFHHTSMMIQAETVITGIGRDLQNGIERLFSTEAGYLAYERELRGEDDIPADFDEQVAYLKAPASGYLQAMDYEALKQVAQEHDLLLRLLYRPGEFLSGGSEIVAVYPGADLSDEIETAIYGGLVMGASRLHIQDVELAIDQLVEIAVRALSPGINDPFTVIACLNQFSTALSTLVERSIPSGYYYDDESHLRLISDAVTFAGIVDSAFNQIRQHGREDVAVSIRLLEVISIIMARATTDEERQALLRQAEMIQQASQEVIFAEDDRRDITERYRLVMRIARGQQTTAES
jgi:uncharacterized membrane protein